MGTAPASGAADGAPAVRFARPESTANVNRSPCFHASLTSFGYTGLSLTGAPCDPRYVPLLPILTTLALGHQTPDSATP